jgi:hypothetical protein
VSVFAGLEERFVSGLVVVQVAEGWSVEDPLGELGEPGRNYGRFASEEDACREALRRLREHLGPPLRVCWGAGSPNEALRRLGFQRGSIRWRWWPPGYGLSGASEIGPDGGPVRARATRISWKGRGAPVSLAIDELEGFSAIAYPPAAGRVHRKLLAKYASDVVLRGGSAKWSEKPVEEALALAPAWGLQLRLIVTSLLWVLERAPGVERVRSLRFQNPSSGAAFISEDERPVEGDVVEGVIRRLMGNRMENGLLWVNEELSFPLSVDGLGRIGLFVQLPAISRWLSAAEAEQRIATLSRALNVPVELRVDLENPQAGAG